MTTPRLTNHARLRCLQMGVRTKRVKRIVREPHVDYPSYGNRICYRDDDELAVVYTPTGSGALVITVLYNLKTDYAREVTP